MQYAQIPMRKIGPVKINRPQSSIEIMVPMATYETTLWPSTGRGAKATKMAGGINCTLVSDSMSRAILLEANDANSAYKATQDILSLKDKIAEQINSSSNFAKLIDLHIEQTGKLLFVRLSINSGDAAGHNMATKAADTVLQFILQKFPHLSYGSISSNYCTDKKVSAVNNILGRGKSVIADIVIPATVCREVLRTTPAAIVELNTKKNLVGSIKAGSLLSANAHFANILLSTFLATGQDAANIVEGSQGITYAALQGEDLYFSVNLPNIIVGAIGHGKQHDFVQENLEQLGCLSADQVGANSQRLAIIIAATVLCGELSLLASLTTQGDLMRAHSIYERQGQGNESRN